MTVLCTQRIPLRRAQVIHLNDNFVRTVYLLSRTVCLGFQAPASATRWTCASARADAVKVLGYSGIVSGVVVPTTSHGFGIAVARTGSVASAVLGEGCLVYCTICKGEWEECEEANEEKYKRGRHGCLA